MRAELGGGRTTAADAAGRGIGRAPTPASPWVAPERATLGVKLAANGEMTIDQLKLRYNRRPSAETQAMVEGWLAEAFRRSDCLPADDG